MDERRSWIEHHHPCLSVRQQCQLLGVNRSNVYYSAAEQKCSEQQLQLLRLVDEVYTQYPFFGTRQMIRYFSLHKQHCTRHQARWAYEKLGLHSLAPGPNTSKPQPMHEVYRYLLKDGIYSASKFRIFGERR